MTFFASRRFEPLAGNSNVPFFPSSVYSTNERYLSAPCPTFERGERTPSNRYKQSGISSSTNTKYVDMWDCPFLQVITALASYPRKPSHFSREKVGCCLEALESCPIRKRDKMESRPVASDRSPPFLRKGELHKNPRLDRRLLRFRYHMFDLC